MTFQEQILATLIGTIAGFFSLQFYREGLASEYLHYEDMKRWNDFLSNHSVGSEQYVLDMIEKWRNSKIEKEDIFQAFKIERDPFPVNVKKSIPGALPQILYCD